VGLPAILLTIGLNFNYIDFGSPIPLKMTFIRGFYQKVGLSAIFIKKVGLPAIL